MLTIAYSSCSSNEELFYYNDEILTQNNINDVFICYEKCSISNDSSVIFYCANRNYKEWFAIFDKGTGHLKQEWYGEAKHYDPGAPLFSISGQRASKYLEKGIYIVDCNNIDKVVKLYKDGSIKESRLGKDVMEVINEDFLLVREENNYCSAVDFEGTSLGINTIKNINVDGTLGFIGYKGDKLWAIFQDTNYKPIFGTQPHDMRKTIHKGYGEYEEIATNVFNLTGIKTEWGLALRNYINSSYIEIICIDENKIEFVGLENPEGRGNMYNWYNNSILIYKHVISPEAKIITTVQKEAEDLHHYSNVFPLNYEECICTTNNQITRFSLNSSKDSISWTSSIPNIKPDARVTYENPHKDKNQWTFKCHIVNKDGSKESLSIVVNIDNGKIQVI